MKIFDIREFGAVGDGKTLNTIAIQNAINACAKCGGRVLISEGTYMTGSLVLRDNIDLHIERTGTLLASPDCDHYPEFEKTHVDVSKLPRSRGASLIYAEKCENISITGMGKIDANGYAFVEKCQPYHWGWTYKRLNLPTPPRVVFFAGCKNILVEDVTLKDPPAGWSYWIHDCDNVTFDRVKILADTEFPNNDGIHINSSRNVSVSNAFISTGDDCIVVRANNSSLESNKICEKIVISNCTLTSHTNAIRIGWLNDGTIRNCTFSNINVTATRTGISITLPERPLDQPLSDEGREDTLIENINFSNFVMDDVYLRPIQIEIANSVVTRCNSIQNISFDNIRSRGIGLPYIVGRNDCTVKNVCFSNCNFERKAPEKLAYFFAPSSISDEKKHGANSLGMPSADLLNESDYIKLRFTDNVSFNGTSFL